MKIEFGLQIDEQEYRKLDYPSYSLLSGISKSNVDAVNGIRADISDLDAIVIGSITDSQVTELKNPDNLYVIDKKPSGKALDAIKKICERNDLTDPVKPLTMKNGWVIDEICDELEYYKNKNTKGRIEALRKHKKYLEALMMHGEKALIASQYQYKQATELSHALFVKYPFLKKKGNIMPQVKLLGEINGVEVKIMLDFIYIDEKRKVVVPFDLKTGYAKHYEFFESGFLGWGYYIQASLYREVLRQNMDKHPILKDYELDNFRFMYCSRQDKLPIIYKVTDKQHDAGFTGFEYSGIKFQGIDELLDDFLYYKNRPNATYRRGFDQPEVEFDDSYL